MSVAALPAALRRPACALLAALALWHGASAAHIHVKAALAQVLLERSWSRTVDAGPGQRPWAWADTWPVARLSVPRTGSDLVVLAGASGRNLAFGPAHLSATAAPGTRGNVVIAGHRDTHFAVLRRLEQGDEIRLQTPDGGRRYRVAARVIVDAAEAWVTADDGRDRLTLVTCYPFDALEPGTDQRYVVTAEPVADAGSGSEG